MRIFAYISFFLFVLASCQKFTWNNPYDSATPKSVFTPDGLAVRQEGENLLLSWSQDNSNISGFKLFRSIDRGVSSELVALNKSTLSYTDANVQGGRTYTYTLKAYADKNESNEVSTEIIAKSRPTINTIAATLITENTATVGGTIIFDGGSPITSKGLVWSTSVNPTIDLTTKTNDGTGSGAFERLITNLSPNTIYYVRAYATNSVGTAYGNQITFTTNKPPAPPILESLTQGLVAYYPFNGNANDESGNGNNGIVNGSPRLSEDRFGKSLSAYNFTQKSDYVKVSNFNLIAGNQARTYSFWTKIPVGSEGGNCLSYGPELLQPGSSCNIGNHIDLNQSTAADCAIVGIGFGINCNQIRKPTQINDGLWHHILILYTGVDGFNGLQFFIDGKLLLSTSCPQGSASSFNTQSINYGITIGRRPDADNYASSLVTFKGDLDDIRIYNRVLTQAEISSLANN